MMYTNNSGDATIIVESPVKARQLSCLTELPILATQGHIFDYDIVRGSVALVVKNLGVLERLGFLNKPGHSIYIATDNDPQGELIAQHVKSATPQASHKRILLNSTEPKGVQFSLNNPIAFNERLASEAAYLRVINLKLCQHNRAQYITTTSVTLAKSYRERGRLNDWKPHTLTIDGQNLFTRLPTGIAVKAKRTTACTTRHLTTLAALHNITELHGKLQKMYEECRLSYIRSDSSQLPNTNYCYAGHVMAGDNVGSHYAIHNLIPASNSIERMVYQVNESAVDSSKKLAVEIATPFGSVYATEERIDNTDLTPESEVMLHLSMASDSYTSTIAKNSLKYSSYFYNHSKLNEALITQVIRTAEKVMPDLVDHGIKNTISNLPTIINQQHNEELTRIIESHNFQNAPLAKLSPQLDIVHSL